MMEVLKGIGLGERMMGWISALYVRPREMEPCHVAWIYATTPYRDTPYPQYHFPLPWNHSYVE